MEDVFGWESPIGIGFFLLSLTVFFRYGVTAIFGIIDRKRAGRARLHEPTPSVAPLASDAGNVPAG